MSRSAYVPIVRVVYNNAEPLEDGTYPLEFHGFSLLDPTSALKELNIFHPNGEYGHTPAHLVELLQRYGIAFEFEALLAKYGQVIQAAIKEHADDLHALGDINALDEAGFERYCDLSQKFPIYFNLTTCGAFVVRQGRREILITDSSIGDARIGELEVMKMQAAGADYLAEQAKQRAQAAAALRMDAASASSSTETQNEGGAPAVAKLDTVLTPKLPTRRQTRHQRARSTDLSDNTAALVFQLERLPQQRSLSEEPTERRKTCFQQLVGIFSRPSSPVPSDDSDNEAERNNTSTRLAAAPGPVPVNQ